MISKIEVEEFASEKGLDVRELNPYCYRLMNERGQYVFDVYFKSKKGRIIRNSVLIWKNDIWIVANSIKDLEKNL